MTARWPKVRLVQVVTPVFRREGPIPGRDYRQIGVRLWGEGAYERESIDGGATKYQHLFRAETGDLIVNKIWARNGSVAVVREDQAGTYGSGEFPMFEPDRTKIDPQWLHWLTKLKWFWAQCDEQAQGTSGKNRITPSRFLEIEIPLPPLDEQRQIVGRIEALAAQIAEARSLRHQAAEETTALTKAALRHMRLSGETITVSIGGCSTMSTGTTPPSERDDYYGGALQWFTPGDLGFHMELDRSTRTLSDAAVADRKARIFQPNTVLLVAIGASLGKVGLTRKKCSANQQITGIRFDDTVLPEYGYWWLKRISGDLMAAAPQATLPIIN